jgi:dTDP-L-rhamnose 4-epimerase
MQILVTGGAGFIGSHTVDALLKAGHRVRVLDALNPPVHHGPRPAHLSSEVDFLHGSVIDREIFRRALDGVDAVFHLAAYQDYLTDFSTFFLTNSVGTALLYELIVQNNLPIQKVVVASSQAIYGEGAYRCAIHGTRYPDQRPLAQLEARQWEIGCPDCGEPMDPQWTGEAVVSPHNSYALSKRDQEDIAVKLGGRYGIPSVALRYSIVQGPRQSFHNAYSGVLRSFAVRVLMGQNPVVYEDGNQLRDYVSVHDVVRANLLVFGDSRADYRAFNVGGGRRVSVRDLAEIVAETAGRKVELDFPGLYRVGDTRHIFSDITQLRELGWRPVVPMPEIVSEYLGWALEQPDLSDTFAQAQETMKETGVLRSTGVPLP